LNLPTFWESDIVSHRKRHSTEHTLSCVRDDRVLLEGQLHRQLLWLKDSWTWIFETRVLHELPRNATRPSALDVGCGPGFVMKLLDRFFDVKGVDKDAVMVGSAKGRGLNVIQADATELPYEDNSFDVVYCSFLMLWLNDPARAIGEMKRVSKRWVICLAEPDYGGRIDHPAELTSLTGCLARDIKELGGDPFVGRKLRSFFNGNGMEAEIGVHQGVWDLEMLQNQSKEEWASIERAAQRYLDSSELSKGKAAWEEAIKSGDLFQYNPIFYALGRKT
jgi:SAM-dependent methyltransferase